MKVIDKDWRVLVSFAKDEFNTDPIQNTIEAVNAALRHLNARKIICDEKVETETNITLILRRGCDCKLCNEHAFIREAIANRDVDKLIALLEKMSNDICNISMDANYNECILDGSWPSSIRQLEEALVKARNHPNRKAEEADRPWFTNEKLAKSLSNPGPNILTATTGE